MKIQQVFGKVIRRRREKAGVSQEALADKAGLHRNYIGLLERGLRTPSIDVLRKLAIGLGASMSSLIGELERLLAKTARAGKSESD